MLKEGVTERDIATELEIFWRRNGVDKPAFDPIIAFGKNTSMPHYSTGNVSLQKNQAVLMDIGVEKDHYCSDMTRMAWYGKVTPEFINIAKIVQAAQKAALDLCRPGVLLSDLDSAARNIISEAGYAENFSHGLGHGIGLEVHEYPSVRKQENDIELQKGMLITIEPGIYIKDFGGVRIEDTVLITDNGYESLTKRSSGPILV